MAKETPLDCTHEPPCALTVPTSKFVSLRDHSPLIAAEFVRVEENPCYTPDNVSRGANARALWKCLTCSHEWSAKLGNRTTLGRGCPECGKKKQALSKTVVPYDQSVSFHHPDVAKEYVDNVENPGQSVDTISRASSKMCKWRCSTCAHEWDSIVSNRTTHGQGCPRCGILKASTSRRVPAAEGSVADRYPQEAAEFVKNLTRPESQPSDIRYGSSDNCVWKCSRCSQTWNAKVSNRTVLGRGCPYCAKGDRVITRRESLPAHRQFMNAHPKLAEHFVKFVSREGLTLSNVSVSSKFKALWECHCGIQFPQEIASVHLAGRVACQKCRRIGKSRLEFEVATILEQACGMTVDTHHKISGFSEVDLYIKEIDTAIQIDPLWSHVHKETSDQRISDTLKSAYTRVVRVREKGLSIFSDCLEVPNASSAAKISKRLSDFLDFPFALTDSQIKTAMEKANTEWDSVYTSGPENAISNQSYADDFVENLTHPGRKAKFTPKHSMDLVRWKCQKCSKRWDEPANKRTKRRYCPVCTANSTIISTKVSFLAKFPDMAKEFVANETTPNKGMDEIMTADLVEQIRWQCSACDTQWVSNARNRALSQTGGCPKCSRELNDRNRMLPKPGKSLAEVLPALANEFVENRTHAWRIPTLLMSGSTDLCVWKCSSCGNKYAQKVSVVKNSFVDGKRQEGPCRHSRLG